MTTTRAKSRTACHAVPRVMHVISPSRMAGAETFLMRLLRRTSSQQVVHHCIASRNAPAKEMHAAGMAFKTVGFGGKFNPLALPRLRREAKEFHANVLHSHLSSASWWCGWLEKFGGPPSIGHVHGFTSARWHRRQTHLIACSEAVKNDLIAQGVAGDRITVMHYPVDPDDQRPIRLPAQVRADFGVAPDTPIVGTFAHLTMKKGYRELIRAAELVLNHIPNAQFWCFGEGKLRPELEAQARVAGISKHFRLFGFRRDVPDLMRAVDVMCLPSHREPFGLVYIEAALAGRPVIACNAGGAPEIIQHGETGLLVKPQDIPDLTDAILTVLDNRTKAVAMGRRGYELALARYGWPGYLKRLHELYDRVLDRQSIQRHANRAA